MKDLSNYESLSVQQKWNMLASVSNMYYNNGLTQNQIANRLYTSRSKISRMLKEARDLGIVVITIKEPWERDLQLEKTLMEHSALKDIRVIKVKDTERTVIRDRVVEAAAYYLESIIKPEMTIGISWGNTLFHVVEYIRNNNQKNIPITVTPIMGAANIASPERDGMDLARSMASSYGGKYNYIFAPLFLKSSELKDNLMSEENIKNALDLAASADIILTSAGSIIYQSWKNLLSQQTLHTLEQIGAVGHIGGHFYNIKGEELDTSLKKRIVGLSFDEIKKCPQTVCVAYSESKADPVIGALKSNSIDTLIVDDKCAARVATYFECQ